jgi:hypothetical protein
MFRFAGEVMYTSTTLNQSSSAGTCGSLLVGNVLAMSRMKHEEVATCDNLWYYTHCCMLFIADDEFLVHYVSAHTLKRDPFLVIVQHQLKPAVNASDVLPNIRTQLQTCTILQILKHHLICIRIDK